MWAKAQILCLDFTKTSGNRKIKPRIVKNFKN